jgi:hypothetical protein
MCGEVVRAESAKGVFDSCVFAIDTILIVPGWMPLLVNHKTRASIIYSGILEIAPIVRPSGLCFVKDADLCVLTLKALISNVFGRTSHESCWAIQFPRVNSIGEVGKRSLGSTFQASIGGAVVLIARLTRDVLPLLFHRARLIAVACRTSGSSDDSILSKGCAIS